MIIFKNRFGSLKIIAVTLLLLFMMLPTHALAEISGDYTFVITGSTAAITGYSGAGGHLIIPEKLSGYLVTSISDDAFEGQSSITSLIIGDNVTRIGDWAFFDCIGLTSISIGKGVTSIGDQLLWGCPRLKTIQVDPDNPVYTSIEDVLINKSEQTLIHYPGGKTTATYTVPDIISRIGDYAFFGSSALNNMIVGDRVTHIGEGAFYECEELTRVSLGGRLLQIGESAFQGCSGLTQIKIPDQVTHIEAFAFSGCSSIKSLKLGNGVAVIETAAFDQCTALTKVTIPAQVVRIGDWAFNGSPKLTDAIFIGNAPEMGSRVFDNSSDDFIITYFSNRTGFSTPTWYGYPAQQVDSISTSPEQTTATSENPTISTDPSEIETDEPATSSTNQETEPVTMENSPSVSPVPSSDVAATDVEDNFIYIVVSGNSIIISYSGQSNQLLLPDVLGGYPVVAIDDGAFFGYSDLVTVTIPEGITRIGNNAFKQCENLSVISIPGSVTSIGIQAFHRCPKLTAINVSDNNTVYSSISGVLLDKNGKSLLKYPAGNAESDYRIPDSVVNIDQFAFAYSSRLTRVNMSEELASIGSQAFYGCNQLSEAVFTGHAPLLGDQVFDNCAPDFKVLFIEGKTGFMTSFWNGYPSESIMHTVAKNRNPHIILSLIIFALAVTAAIMGVVWRKDIFGKH